MLDVTEAEGAPVIVEVIVALVVGVAAEELLPVGLWVGSCEIDIV